MSDVACSAYSQVLSFNFESAKDSSKFSTQDQARIESLASSIFSKKRNGFCKAVLRIYNNNNNNNNKIFIYPDKKPISQSKDWLV